MVKLSIVQDIHSILADASRWSHEIHIPLSWIVGASLGMEVPVAIGAATNHTSLGMLASIGGLALSGASGYGALRRQCTRLFYALITSTTAILLGSVFCDHGWITGAAIVITVSVASLLGSINRTVAWFSGLFTILLLIGVNLEPGNGSNPAGIVLIFIVGALWTMIASLVASYLFQAWGIEQKLSPASTVNTQQPAPSFKRQLIRWHRSLSSLAGWQYTMRLCLCILAAEIIIVVWHQPLSYWIAIVAAIIVQRDFDATIGKAFQRTIGTIAGVLLGSVLLLWLPPTWFMAIAIGVLSGLRPLLKVRNYVLYATVMTPLIVIVLNFGNAVTPAVIVYRLIDTVIGFTIAVGLGYLLWLPLNPLIAAHRNI
ncbi:MAG TPA: FUSC family protein [Methanocella sp.]|nr:FUSC family protein [Methanocella sp.]